MNVTECENKIKHDVRIEPVIKSDYKKLTKSKYFFNWQTERLNEVYKLTLLKNDEILGVMSLIEHVDQRLEINLLSVSITNRGKKKVYEGIAGNLIAWACREAILRFDGNACISLVPKTKLKLYYIKAYGMKEAGQSLFLSDDRLNEILNRYKL